MLLGNTHKQRKVDRGNDFNDYCQIPVTNTCRVLVLDPTDFTALLYLCFSKPYTGPYGAHRITSRNQRDTTVPSFLHCADQLFEILGAVLSVASIICISLYRNKSVVNEFIDCARELTASGRQSAEGGRGCWQA